MIDPDSVRLAFTAELWHWRGPSPYHFLSVPADACELLRSLAPVVSYGWGVIPVRARTGETSWETSLIPRNGGYALPVKDVVRTGAGLAVGDTVSVSLTLR